MLKTLLTTLLLCAAPCWFCPAMAGEVPVKLSAEAFAASLHYQQGKIVLPGGIASLNLPASFRYLPPDDTARVLADAWGNPPGAKTLGMIVPAEVSPLSDTGWGVIVTYDQDGHVKDDDADSIKYPDLLKDMKESVQSGNDERKRAGYPAMSLIGWAEAPSYDKRNHKLYWAKELSTDGARDNTLNYNIRVLGRNGVLVLNAVAGMSQLGAIKGDMQHVTAFTEFSDGNRYADFDSKTDKVAEYGIAALVAGGIAAKLGLFGKLLGFLLLFKKVLVLALAGGASAIYKFFGGKRKDGLSNNEEVSQEAELSNKAEFAQNAEHCPKVDLSK